MSPKEWEFVFKLLQDTARHAYDRGYKDSVEGKAADNQRFTLTRSNAETIKSELNKFARNR